jgi:putative acetyltransferase
MLIRTESTDDDSAIHAVTKRAFNGAPHSEGSEPNIIRSLRMADALTVSLVADEDGVVVGHIAFSPVTISDGSGAWYGLGPVSVEPNRQRQGIGSHLVRAGVHRLRELAAQGCVVVGDPRYYSRFGFRVCPGLIYPGVPPEYFMALPLGTKKPQGEVAYHSAFTPSC